MFANEQQELNTEYIKALSKVQLVQKKYEYLFDKNNTGLGEIDEHFFIVLEDSKPGVDVQSKTYNSKFLEILQISEVDLPNFKNKRLFIFRQPEKEREMY